MTHNLKESIESLTRMRKELETVYLSESAVIDVRLEEIKNSLLETLSLLEPPPRITLRKRMADCFTSMRKWVNLKNTGNTLYWLILFIAVVIAFVCGQSVNEQKHQKQEQHEERQVNPTPEPPALLTMTQTEHDLLRSAARLVNRDIDQYESVGEALSAFYAESPMSIRDAVIEKLGGIRSLEDFPKALEDVLGRIVVIEGVRREELEDRS